MYVDLVSVIVLPLFILLYSAILLRSTPHFAIAADNGILFVLLLITLIFSLEFLGQLDLNF